MSSNRNVMGEERTARTIKLPYHQHKSNRMVYLCYLHWQGREQWILIRPISADSSFVSCTVSRVHWFSEGRLWGNTQGFSGRVVGGIIASPRLATGGRVLCGGISQSNITTSLLLHIGSDVCDTTWGSTNSPFPPTALALGASGCHQEVSHFGWHGKWWSCLQLHLRSLGSQHICCPNVGRVSSKPTARSLLRF